jgi:hypothetical protein
MQHPHNTRTRGAIPTLVTVIITVLATLAVVAVVLTIFGTERVAQEVSPFVESAKERVVENVVPPSQQEEPKTEADIIMEAVAANQGNSVLIYEQSATGEEFVARGIMISTDGRIVTDEAVIHASSSYVVAVPGTRGRLAAAQLAVVDGLAVLDIPITTTLVASFTNTTPSGQELVVAITGTEEMSIATGIITDTATSGVLDTNIYGVTVPGSSLVAKNGRIYGIATVATQDDIEASFQHLTQDKITEIAKISLDR